MNNTLEKDYAAGLFDNCEPPCLSLYQPTYRNFPENKQDPIRFKNLVKKLEESLLRQYPKEDVGPLLKQFRELSEDREFWNHTLDGLAVLGSKGFFQVYTFQRSVPELAVAADNFHTKPLWRILQSADRYQILAVNRKEMKLFEGNRDALDEIMPAPGVPKTLVEALGEELTDPRLTVSSYGGVGVGKNAMHHGHGGKKDQVDLDAERFFRTVDRAVMEHHSQPSGLPLILAALPEHHHLFHDISRNPSLLPEGITIHPDSLSSLDELRQLAWGLVEPRYLKILAGYVDKFGSARAEGLGEDDLSQVAKAIIDGRVGTLLVEADREIPGRVDPATGEVEQGEMMDPKVDDLLDDLGQLALKKGGTVVVVPAERMPTKTGIAAIYRF
ncbi:baeRF3 domain-containing protein [Desulfonatronum parangueonense]